MGQEDNREMGQAEINLLTDILNSSAINKVEIVLEDDFKPTKKSTIPLCVEDVLKFEVVQGELFKVFGKREDKVLFFDTDNNSYGVIAAGDFTEEAKASPFCKNSLIKPVTLVPIDVLDIQIGDFLMAIPELDQGVMEEFMLEKLYILVLPENRFVIIDNESIIECQNLSLMLEQHPFIFKVVAEEL